MRSRCPFKTSGSSATNTIRLKVPPLPSTHQCTHRIVRFCETFRRSRLRRERADFGLTLVNFLKPSVIACVVHRVLSLLSDGYDCLAVGKGRLMIGNGKPFSSF